MEDRHLIDLAFGRESVQIFADPKIAKWEVFRPAFEPSLDKVEARFREALRNPIGCRPLRELVLPSDRVVVVTSDGTRPVPNRLLIPWILEELPVSDDQVTVLLGNGTHRSNSPEEILEMFGETLVNRVEILNHDCFDPTRNEWVGRTKGGVNVGLDSLYLKADKRVVLGFIEPHFFAGFSGGAKGVAPGIASEETILSMHRAELISDPKSTWGLLEGNPIQEEISEAVSFCPPEFLVNVTLNSEKEITGFFAGDYREAHQEGCRVVKQSAMVSVQKAFPIVVTSNSGYPLDQNLYQTVKGISAAARITENGGTILVASECSDGIPDSGNFFQIMQKSSSSREVLKLVNELEYPILDQWQAQILAGILERVEVWVYSRMNRTEIEGCKLFFLKDLDSGLKNQIRRVGNGARIAILPEGPLSIPYLEGDLNSR